jgi:epoxyqueuosine reductase
MDSRLCISYLTIERRGALDDSLLQTVGSHVYGCDICQEVCPWNLTPSPPASTDPVWQPRAGLDAPLLLSLWQQSDEGLRALLKGSAMKRAGVKRLRRNLAVAIGNSGTPDHADALVEQNEPSCAEPLVGEHVEWAVRKLHSSVAESSCPDLP